MTVTQTKPTAQAGPATIEDLYRVDGKAELVNGVIVEMDATGEDPGYAGDEILCRLADYAKEEGTGRAVSDSKGFVSICRTASRSARTPPITSRNAPA